MTPQSAPSQPPQNPMTAIISVLAGAGFDKFSKGLKNLGESGMDLNKMMSMPSFPLMLAGAGLKDSANSMEVAGPLIQQMMPPQPKPEDLPPEPQKLSAAMGMLSQKLGPGLSGIGPR